MRTEDLINALAADGLRAPPVARGLVLAMAGALGVAALAFALVLGPRAGIGAVLGSVVVTKTLVPALIGVLAGAAALAMVHPGAHRGMARALAGLGLVGAGGVFLWTLLAQGTGALVHALSAPDLWVCLVSVPTLAVPLLGAMLWGLSAGAATAPRWAGAAAGLAAGGLSAAVYSLYCTKDMVLFVVPAYGAAMLLVVGAGALLGPRVLRW